MTAEFELSSRLTRLLREGTESVHADRYKSDEWSILVALVTGMHRAQWSESRARATLNDRRNGGGAILHSCTPEKAKRLFDRAWAKAEEWRSQPVARRADHARQRAERYAAVIAAMPARAPSDRAICLAAAEVARLAGCTEFSASYRRLAELSGVSLRTVMRRVPRLVERGWLIQRSRARHCLRADGTYEDQPTIWQLPGADKLSPLSAPQGLTPVVTTCPFDEALALGMISGDSLSTRDALADAFAWRALGSTALLILLALWKGTDPGDLNVVIGLHRRTVRRHLLRLHEHGLSGRQLTSRELNAIAAEYGTRGRALQQREQHRAQRASRRRRDGVVSLAAHRRRVEVDTPAPVKTMPAKRNRALS
jgi:hypothetical protein